MRPQAQGLVRRRNDENSFCVLQVKAKSRRDFMTVVGSVGI